MMGYKILEHLDGGNPRLPFVSYTGLSTHSHNHMIVLHAVNKRLERIWEHLRIRIDLDDRCH